MLLYLRCFGRKFHDLFSCKLYISSSIDLFDNLHCPKVKNNFIFKRCQGGFSLSGSSKKLLRLGRNLKIIWHREFVKINLYYPKENLRVSGRESNVDMKKGFTSIVSFLYSIEYRTSIIRFYKVKIILLWLLLKCSERNWLIDIGSVWLYRNKVKTLSLRINNLF